MVPGLLALGSVELEGVVFSAYSARDPLLSPVFMEDEEQ